MSIKERLITLRTRWSLKKNQGNRGSTPFKRATEIGILFSVEDREKHEAIKEFVKSLEIQQKRVQVIGFLPKKKENFDFLFNFFTEEDVSTWGNIKSPDAIRFSNTAFDYLYCFDVKPNPFIQNILARSVAKCRIGQFWKDGEQYLDLMIANVASTKSLIQEAYKYTKDLK